MQMLFVLLWRHKRSRLNTWIKSCVEILLPIAIFLMFFFVKDYLARDLANIETVQYMESVPINEFYTPDLVLCYPKTPETQLLMEYAANELSLRRLFQEPVHGKSRGYYFLPNISSIPLYAEKLLDDEAIIIFENIADKCPEKLNYTIKMKNDFKTTEYLPPNEKLEAHSAFGTMYESFLKLQWAVDAAFLRTCLGTHVAKAVSFQEFPSIVVSIRVHMQMQLFSVAFQAAILIVFIYHTVRIMEERQSGILELVKASGVSTLMIGLGHFINTVIVGFILCVVAMLVLILGSTPVLCKSSALLLVSAMLLTVISFIILAFILAHVLPLMKDASSIATLVFILLVLPSSLILLTLNRAGTFARMLTGLLPMVPFNWILSVATEFESEEKIGLSFKTLLAKSFTWKLSPFHGYLALSVQILLYSLLAYYLALIRPGRNGVGLKWNFMYKDICTNDLLEPEDPEAIELQAPSTKRGIYFESAAPPTKHGIKLRCISKYFGRNQVLKDINMNIYEGEITVLLGHNGAGKTTLMTIAAALQDPTSGVVYVEGMDVKLNKYKVTKLIGMCPQENIFFKDMNVLDHAMFFTMIRKDVSVKQAYATSEALLGRLNLITKMKSFDSKLSGGMKRRLQLCMAMAGDSRVLILDEPTSGLDVETRRDLWNLLLTLRGNRTVILSTHFMEEADALGDRIAALHSGELKCYATPMFLKKAIGEGYRLTLVTIGIPQDPQISYIIFQMIPEATLKEKTTNSVSYNLPSAYASKFPEVFELLESAKAELGIESIGMGTSTLDEVFMRLCSDTPVAETTKVTPQVPVTEYEKISGFSLLVSQMRILTWRHFKYLFYNKYNYIIFLIVLPLFLICVCAKTFSTASGVEQLNINRRMDISLYRDMPGKKVLFNVNAEREINLAALQTKYPDVEFVPVEDVVEEAIKANRIGENHEIDKYLMGFEVNKTHATVLYTTHFRHAAPVALNMLSNGFAYLHQPAERTVAETKPESTDNPISVYNDPVRGTIKYAPDDNNVNVLPTSANEVLLLSKNIPAVILLSITWCMAPLFLEMENSQRHILLMNGCTPTVYWVVTLAFFTFIFAVPLLPGTILFLVVFDKSNMFSQLKFLVTLGLLIVLSMMVFLAFLFWLTGMTTEKTAYLSAVLIICFCTFVVPVLRDVFPEYALKSLDILVSPLLFQNSMEGVCTTARINAFCLMNKNRCPDLRTTVLEFLPFVEKCCESEGNPQDYFHQKTTLNFVYLLLHFIIFMILTICAQSGYFVKLLEFCYNRKYVPIVPLVADEVIQREKQYVTEALRKNDNTDTLLVKNLHKRYASACGRKKFCALQGINFSVKKNECFAVLGINGAGKTTMFQAITGEIPFTAGEVQCDGFKPGSRQYLHSLGYCPQHNSMDVFLTGKENLELILRLRGFTSKDAKVEAGNLIKLLALEKHADKLVYKYSGGCRRRLAAGGALCGPALAVLDEPSSGVDVAARRALWAALKRPHALLVASHSMEEVEALAARLLILAGGFVRAVGSPAEIRSAHANGHSLRFLMNAQALKHTQIGLLKESIKKEFTCTLKDEHKTMLYYHIDETMKYSVIFSKLENIKMAFADLVVDYSVQETTLEEVFLTFAREHDHEGKKRRSRIRSVMI